jgi:hypothetical protein
MTLLKKVGQLGFVKKWKLIEVEIEFPYEA